MSQNSDQQNEYIENTTKDEGCLEDKLELSEIEGSLKGQGLIEALGEQFSQFRFLSILGSTPQPYRNVQIHQSEIVIEEDGFYLRVSYGLRHFFPQSDNGILFQLGIMKKNGEISFQKQFTQDSNEIPKGLPLRVFFQYLKDIQRMKVVLYPEHSPKIEIQYKIRIGKKLINSSIKVKFSSSGLFGQMPNGNLMITKNWYNLKEKIQNLNEERKRKQLLQFRKNMEAAYQRKLRQMLP